LIDVRKELIDNADKKNSEFQARVVPGADKILGVRTPVLREISKEICKDDWRAFLNEPVIFFEDRMLRALVIATAKMEFDERLGLAKMFIPEINNWAVCDIFCCEWNVKKGSDKGKLWEYCLELIEADDEFRMRVSAVMMLYHFLDDEHIDDVLRLLTTKYHPGYYYRMGAAWALSFSYIKYPEKTEVMLFRDTLDKNIRNKAVQKISDSYRVSREDKERLKLKKKAL